MTWSNQANVWLTLQGLLCLFTVLACRVTIQEPAGVDRPVPVYLAHYDRYHTSLVIPGERVATEFTYGDLDLFAHYNQSFWPAFKGMSFPTQGVLGRRVVGWDGHDVGALRVALNNQESCNRISTIHVDPNLLANLAEDLQRSFESASGSAIHNEHLGITFVCHPTSYTFLRNCNHQLADWLERLDCKVGYGRAMAKFEVLDSR